MQKTEAIEAICANGFPSKGAAESLSGLGLTEQVFGAWTWKRDGLEALDTVQVNQIYRALVGSDQTEVA